MSVLPDWERFAEGCRADAERLRADEARWATKPARGRLQPQFGQRPAVSGRRGRAAQVGLFEESGPLFGGLPCAE